jgi:2-methylisocitrate lyase-like PEP mutase family enzyme
MSDQAASAGAFRAMHVPGEPVVLVNVWDAASARVVAATPGARAIATASWSVSEALGYRDGGNLPLDAVLANALTIVAATDLPVTVDFEKGYATSPDDVARSVTALLQTGAIGLNIEDSVGSEDGALFDIAAQAARIRAVRAAGDAAGVPIVINARTDVMVGGGSLDDAIARGRAYLEAGADCIFVIGQAATDNAALVDALGKVSVMGYPGSPAIGDLASMGVCRISMGPGTMGAAYAALHDLAASLLAGADFPDAMGYRLG